MKEIQINVFLKMGKLVERNVIVFVSIVFPRVSFGFEIREPDFAAPDSFEIKDMFIPVPLGTKRFIDFFCQRDQGFL